MQRRATRTPSSHIARLWEGSTPNASSGGRRSFAGAELDATVRQDVEGRDALRDAGGMVDRRERVHDAVGETDPLGALRRGGEEQLRGARVRVLLEEVVLDDPHAVDADAIGVLDLLERLVHHPPLVAVLPRAGNLVLVEESELHRGESNITM
jgi:hypothetical protein